MNKLRCAQVKSLSSFVHPPCFIIFSTFRSFEICCMKIYMRMENSFMYQYWRQWAPLQHTFSSVSAFYSCHIWPQNLKCGAAVKKFNSFFLKLLRIVLMLKQCCFRSSANVLWMYIWGHLVAQTGLQNNFKMRKKPVKKFKLN